MEKLLTWKEAVGRVGRVAVAARKELATELALCIQESDRVAVVVRELIREAHFVHRHATRQVEVAAMKRQGHVASIRQIVQKEARTNARRRLGPILEVLRKDYRVEWTEELLARQFTLRDGSCVLWGEATVAEHKQRIDIFMDSAAAQTAAAARHAKAIRDIEERGVSCLNEVVMESVA